MPACVVQWWNVAAPGTLMNDMKSATRVGNYGVSGPPCSATCSAVVDASPHDRRSVDARTVRELAKTSGAGCVCRT